MKQFLKRIYRSLFPIPVNNLKADISLTTPSERLKGRNIAIIGGTRGIGRAMAEKFLAEGAKVLITGRRKDNTDKVAAEIGSSAFAVDVSICCDFSQFISHCVETMGQLDTLVLNAGISLHEGDILNVTPEQFDAQMSTNLRGAYFAAQAFVKYVTENSLRRANLLFVSSERGEYVDMLPYGLTKAAMNSLVRGLARRCIKFDMRVNALAPGVTATELTGYDAESNLFRGDQMSCRIYLPQEMAEVALFLISDISNCLTGQILVCNEGKSINSYF